MAILGDSPGIGVPMNSLMGRNDMRYLSMLGVVLLGLILWQPGKSNAAPAYTPPGSYRQTCKNIKMRGDTLRARCKNTYDQWVNTSLDYVSQCTGDIANVDGQLQCNTGGDGGRYRDRDRGGYGGNGGYGNAPSGSYTQTCRDIQVRGNTLRATCQTTDNQWVDTYLNKFNRCNGEIENDNGRLRCTRNRRY